MVMELVFKRVEALPRLAWCAEVTRGSDRAELLHGPWVETRGRFFCDGAWSGDFAVGAFERSMLAGTAGKATRDGLLLAAPNNTLERIYLVEVGDAVLASNSLAFLLARSDDDVDPRRLGYSSSLASIVGGLKKHVRSIPTLRGRRVRLFYHTNLRVTRDLEVIEEPKPPVRDFRDFADYKAFLQETLTAIAANAADRRRRVKFPPIATISSGHDSPAVAVLAKHAGCSQALTFQRARPSSERSDALDDSGAEIAALLGMEITCFERSDYLKVSGLTEAENEGFPLVFAAWQEKIAGRLLLTGYHGDKVWDRNAYFVGSDIVRGDYSGNTFAEFRLRVGFIHLPVPYLGCTRLASIYRISNSPEMRPWSLMNKYDRPIPRRLIEEAGVPRELFGRAKKAVEVVRGIEGNSILKQESVEEFERFCQENWNRWMAAKARALACGAYIHRLNKRFNRKIHFAVKMRFGVAIRLPEIVPHAFRAAGSVPGGRDRLLFHWAVRKLLPRYHIAPSWWRFAEPAPGEADRMFERVNG
jgi:hypothetical protein